MTAGDRVILWAVIIVVVALAGGGAVLFFAWKRHDARFAGAHQQREEGLLVGAAASWGQCLEQGLARRARAATQSLDERAASVGFLDACLSVAPLPAACAGAPLPGANREVVRQWSTAFCADAGVDAPGRCADVPSIQAMCLARRTRAPPP